MKKIIQLIIIPLGIAALIVFPGAVLTQAQVGNNVSAVDNSFSPLMITVNQGDTVTWVNNGAHLHTVTADDGSFDSGSLAPGASFSQTFTTAGTVAYHCSFHGASDGVGMAGTVVVLAATSSSSSTSSATSSSAGEPIISNVMATSSANGTRVTITWSTDQPATSQVSYGTSSNYTASTTLDASPTTNHLVTLSNLIPSTVYHFSVVSSDNNTGGGQVMSSDQTVTTTIDNDLPGNQNDGLRQLRTEIRELIQLLRSLIRQRALMGTTLR